MAAPRVELYTSFSLGSHPLQRPNMAATLRKAAIFIAFLAGAFELTRNTPFFYNLRGYSAYSRVKVGHVLSHKLRNSSFSSRPVSVWTKHGYVSLFCPFAVDLTVAMDV